MSLAFGPSGGRISSAQKEPGKASQGIFSGPVLLRGAGDVDNASLHIKPLHRPRVRI